MGAGDALAEVAEAPGICVLTACAATQAAWALPGETYTVFSGILIRLLAEGIPGNPELLDMQSLYQQIRAELAARPRRQPGGPSQLPELGSRGSPGDICIARNVSGQRRRTPEPDPAPPVESRPPPRKATGVPARMSALVRDCLLRPPQPRRLYVSKPGMPDSKELTKARTTHQLDRWEEVIAVWQWGKVLSLLSATPDSLAFTSTGIHIAQGKFRLLIKYAEIGKYAFEFERAKVYVSQGYTISDHLIITGPNAWKSPGADGAEFIVRDLNRIRELAAG